MFIRRARYAQPNAATSITRTASCATSAAETGSASTCSTSAATSRSSDGTGPCCAPGSSSCSSARATGAAVLSARGGAGCPAHRRATPQSRTARRSRAPRPADGGCEFLGVDPPAARSAEDVGLWAWSSSAALLERLGFNGTQRALDGHHHRAHGSTGLGARQLALAVRAFGPRRVAGRGLRADERCASTGRCPAGAARGDRGPVRARGDLFALPQTVTLYDLTNTFFEGEAAAQPKAERGHSKEKRSDCPLLTLGLVLDGAGFVRRSEVFAGAVNEDTTLGPCSTPCTLRRTPAGIATEANVVWLRENGYRYLGRERARRFDPAGDCPRDPVAPDGPQGGRGGRGRAAALLLRIAARSPRASRVSCGSTTASSARAPASGSTMSGSGSAGSRRRAAVSGRTTSSMSSPMTAERRPAPSRERRPLAGTMITHPGVYCLRTNVEDWDEETLWRTYTALTDVEAVFRSLKSELGLRPIFHQQKRSDGHLFITVIAYQLVQTIRRRRRARGARAGPACDASSKASSASRQPSGARTAAPFMCANRRARSSDNGPSIRRSPQTPFPEASGR